MVFHFINHELQYSPRHLLNKVNILIKDHKNTDHYKILEPTPYGPVGIIWGEINGTPLITGILFSRPDCSAGERITGRYLHSRESSCSEIDTVAGAIRACLEGEAVKFPLEIADPGRCTPFQLGVLRAEHGIPRGRVSTYGLIAAYLGKNKAARAVGNALAANPYPIIVPCHRAIRSDRHPGGFQGGTDMKRSLLETEGVRFDDTGRVLSMHLH